MKRWWVGLSLVLILFIAVKSRVATPVVSVIGDAATAKKSFTAANPKAGSASQAPAPAPAPSSQALVTDVLDTRLSGNERSRKMYLLTQAGPAAMADLAQVARAPLRGSQTDFEVSLRVRAVEALDRMTAARSDDVVRQFEWIASARDLNPTVAMLVNIGVMGIRQGKPGKVTRFIDRVLKEGKTL